jgi:phosphoribosylformylglycinamidine (FGAM) synthase-like amidotransferase family enzyme
MGNVILALMVVSVATLWRRSGFWLPAFLPLSARHRRRTVLVAGTLVCVLVGGFSLGDVIGGRTQISRSPVRYATRLSAPAAHHHDVADLGLFWRQVLLQTGLAFAVGGALIALSLAPVEEPRRVA